MRLIACTLLFLLTFMRTLSAAEAPAIHSFTLGNGMQVVLVESHRVPAVTHMIWYRVGAADDFPGRSGLAHYNEHMMFQGTTQLGSGEFARRVEENGGEANAFTSHDYTAYYVNIAKERLPLIMQMEADRMLHLAPTAENFAKERQVIIEERRMSIENRPDALLAEALHAMLYRNHPYHNPIIGWMHEMLALSREDVLDFHRQFYHPSNAVLIVAGDITEPELKKLAATYYAPLPAGEKYVRHWRSEPPQRGARSIVLRHANVRQPQFLRLYTAPSAHDGDTQLVVPAFVLTQILSGGSTSRLYQDLVVRQKVATAINVDYDGFAFGPGEMRIDATPAAGVTLEQLGAAIDKDIGSICATPIAPDELARARTLLKADTIYARDGLEGMARTLGGMLMAGLPVEYFNDWPKKIDAVSGQDVCAAAAIFNPDASATGYLLPEKEEK